MSTERLFIAVDHVYNCGTRPLTADPSFMTNSVCFMLLSKFFRDGTVEGIVKLPVENCRGEEGFPDENCFTD